MLSNVVASVSGIRNEKVLNASKGNVCSKSPEPALPTPYDSKNAGELRGSLSPFCVCLVLSSRRAQTNSSGFCCLQTLDVAITRAIYVREIYQSIVGVNAGYGCRHFGSEYEYSLWISMYPLSCTPQFDVSSPAFPQCVDSLIEKTCFLYAPRAPLVAPFHRT